MYVCYKKDKLTIKAFSQDYLWMIFSFVVIDKIDLLLDTYGNFVRSNFQQFGIKPLSIEHWPSFFQILFYLIVYEFFGYWTHRIAHSVTPLWKLHIVHHSTKYLNVLSAFRVSWALIILTGCLGSIYYGFLSTNEDLIAVVLLFVLMVCHINHSKISFNDKYLSIFFITPRLHRWHHSVEMKFKYGQNFSAVLTFWDRVFGTYYNLGEAEELGINHLDDNYPNSFLGRILYPFFKIK